MITIVKPHSVYADRTDANEFELEWSSTVPGQTGYEIYYKLSDAANWSTTGLISDPTATTYDLRQIYTLLEIDFTEIIYKIKLYYSTENEEGLLTGVEESDIYTIIFSQPISAYLSVYDGEDTERYPLFTSVESNYDKFNVQTDNGKLLTALVDEESPIASNLKIHVGNNDLALASEYATGLAYTPNKHGDWNQEGYSYYYYYYNKYSSNTYYYYTNPSDKYYYYYSYVKSNYNYTYSQKQSSATTTTKSDKYYYFYKNDKYYVYSTKQYYAYNKYTYYYTKKYYASYTYTNTYASLPQYYYMYNAYYIVGYTIIYTYQRATYASTQAYKPSDTYYYYYYKSSYINGRYYYYQLNSKTYKYSSTDAYTTYIYNNSTTYKYNTSTYNYYYNYSNTTTTYYYKSNPSNTYYYYKNNYGGYYYYYINTQTMYSQLYSYNYQT